MAFVFFENELKLTPGVPSNIESIKDVVVQVSQVGPIFCQTDLN